MAEYCLSLYHISFPSGVRIANEILNASTKNGIFLNHVNETNQPRLELAIKKYLMMLGLPVACSVSTRTS